MKDAYKEFLNDIELSYKSSTYTTDHDTEFLWLPDNQSLFIRGTDSLVDWFFNLLFFPDQGTGFHTGFYLKAIGIIDFCILKGISPTTVVGHSAGGALAQWVAFFFNCDAYSLACPKTVKKTGINKNFYKWADSNLVIINQKNDIVGKMPPILLEHPVEPLWLDNEDFFIFAHHLISFE